MTQENKELLFKDLCARLPYRVVVSFKNSDTKEAFNQILDYTLVHMAEYIPYIGGIEIKPYLRPMSSMTEEEKEELKILFDAEDVTSDSICYLEGGTLEEYLSHISYSFCSKIIDWLLAHYIDFHGLIPMGLAIEVTKENNPYI